MTAVLIETETYGSGSQVARRVAFGVVRTLIGTFRRMSGWRHRKWIEAQLRQMSDRQLRDVGMRRAEVSFITLGLVRQH